MKEYSFVQLKDAGIQSSIKDFLKNNLDERGYAEIKISCDFGSQQPGFYAVGILSLLIDGLSEFPNKTRIIQKDNGFWERMT